MKTETAELFYTACVGDDPEVAYSPLEWLAILLRDLQERPSENDGTRRLHALKQSIALLDALKEAVEQAGMDYAPRFLPQEDGRRVGTWG